MHGSSASPHRLPDSTYNQTGLARLREPRLKTLRGPPSLLRLDGGTKRLVVSPAQLGGDSEEVEPEAVAESRLGRLPCGDPLDPQRTAVTP
jgi:hypothetical protein